MYNHLRELKEIHKHLMSIQHTDTEAIRNLLERLLSALMFEESLRQQR